MHFHEALFMKDALLSFIMNKNFPCVMAKAVASKGMLSLNQIPEIETDATVRTVLEKFYQFIDNYRKRPERLSSFILAVDKDYSFEEFENMFWAFLKKLNELDKEKFCHDPRVSGDVNDNNFSFSVKEEAFFILALHPDSPRLSRRFQRPAIVFNPHQQFENLRITGIFNRIKEIIRKRDFLLQGSSNPMLNDFGDKSEIYQYMGRVYSNEDVLSL
jgi:FPC/CPF motif-containing protein YcgG